jgi:hypothetical protein
MTVELSEQEISRDYRAEESSVDSPLSAHRRAALALIEITCHG